MVTLAIDLGTTNSLVSCWKDGEVHLIPTVFESYLTPSVVGVDDKGAIITGAPAKERLRTHPDHTVAAFKRAMGSDKLFKIGSHILRAEELSSFVLKSLKADAEAWLGTTVTQAIISVPAYFNDLQRKATVAAGRLAGLQVLRLVNEPTAAALAHGLHESESTFVVLDIGGGTFDISIMELFEGIMQIRSSAGDNYLGGEDFVDLIIKSIADKHAIQLEKLTGQQLAGFREVAENLMKTVSTQQNASYQLVVNETIDGVLTRQEFATLSEPLLQRVRQPLERAIRDAGLKKQDLNAVVLAGGASRMPLIRSLAAQLIGLIPTSSQNPDEIICRGVAIQVGLYERDASLEDKVMTDVAPYSLGINVHNEHADKKEYQPLFSPIIERNSPVPVSRSDVYYSMHDNQKSISFNIYQGEQRLAKDNIELGTMSIAIPPKPAGEVKVEVRFTYDINGLLEVDAKVWNTDIHEQLIVQGNSVMSNDEIQARLASLSSLKIHPREQLENTYIMMRGARLYEEALGDIREEIGEKLSFFEAILNRQHHEEIKEAAAAIKAFLDEVEAALKV